MDFLPSGMKKDDKIQVRILYEYFSIMENIEKITELESMLSVIHTVSLAVHTIKWTYANPNV